MTEHHKILIKWSFDWLLKHHATMSQMCMFHCCLECQTMSKEILDPQYFVIVDPSKTICANFSWSNTSNLNQKLVMTKWFFNTWYINKYILNDYSFLDVIVCVRNSIYTCISNCINNNFLCLSLAPAMVSESQL